MKEWRNYDHVPAAEARAGGLFPHHVCETVAAIVGVNNMNDRATLDLAGPATLEGAIVAALGARAIVLVGMMGAGKSSIGRRLAQRLEIPFVDADAEIEIAAGMSIADIFATRGEPEFRAGEARVIARLLEGGAQVVATGGGAFMNADTRAAIKAKGISVWLNADFDVLMRRIKRRNDRPLLKTDDPAAKLQELIDLRYPTYALADLTVQSRDVVHEKIVDELVGVLAGHLGLTVGEPAAAGGDCAP
jgi:shikimate kinase